MKFVRLNFKEYNKLFDLSQLDIKFTADSFYKNNFKMQTLQQLDKVLDSINKFKNTFLSEQNQTWLYILSMINTRIVYLKK